MPLRHSCLADVFRGKVYREMVVAGSPGSLVVSRVVSPVSVVSGRRSNLFCTPPNETERGRQKR